MTINREERPTTQTELVITSVTCDRCGEPARHMTGIGVPRNYEFEGCYVRGKLYPTANSDDAEPINLELCGECTKDLKAWVKVGV